jgi:hypothetical protein
LIGRRAFSGTGVKQLVIPASVEVIGKECFCDCGALREVVFEKGSKLKEIGSQAFDSEDGRLGKLEIPPKCEILDGFSLRGIASVTISKENPFLVIEDSFLKTSDGKRLIRYMGSEQQVVVKKEVEVIGAYCFCMQYFLHTVIFEEGSSLRRLERECLGRTGLVRVTIPASVEAIGKYCFYGCSSLRAVVYEGQVADIAHNAFSGCIFL